MRLWELRGGRWCGRLVAAATFLLCTCGYSHIAGGPLQFHHPLTCGVGDTVLYTTVGLKSSEGLAPPSEDFCRPQLPSREAIS